EHKRGCVGLKDVARRACGVRGANDSLWPGGGGHSPPPAPSARRDPVTGPPRREHSRKPDQAYELIEAMYPELPKIELFAREARSGWDAWGNEIDKYVEDDVA